MQVLDILRSGTSRVGLTSGSTSASDLSSFRKRFQAMNPVLIPQRRVDTVAHSQAYNGAVSKTKALVAASHYRRPVVNPRINNIVKQTGARGKASPLRVMSYAISDYASNRWSSRSLKLLKNAKSNARQISYDEMIQTM